jgi:hypothetical protein
MGLGKNKIVALAIDASIESHHSQEPNGDFWTISHP